MAFRFNFPNPENPTYTENVEEAPFKDVENEKLDISNKEHAKEIFMKDNEIDMPEDVTATIHTFNDVEVHCYNSESVEEYLCRNRSQTSNFVAAVSAHSDLVPDKYEGGLTVWECSLDLAEYLTTNKSQLQDTTVLELGCGAGIPGLCTMQCGASEVHFQDYNSEVIEYFTIQNVRLHETWCHCRFFSGDWSYFYEIIRQQKYDVILSAETIYNPDNYKSLQAVFKSCLSEDGVIYLAAKSHYFGVGGGVHMFEEFIKKEGNFNIEVAHTINTEVPRVILKLTWK
ncbi:histidine protein methyltransferase 1 homolog isoform X2 [Mizuhopecten yessoensis]|uniref:histidine protein methyltransferase 1 homolog isoform X2 n=1 Tax=Mizuhopecten yessoensis TaxID=6573 RepID=UPI000B45A64E|nr:histidine protein methyltransferase 1 homolog isoform X2 [Mizuhopecten yessoensis]